jgi:hypothetical protein
MTRRTLGLLVTLALALLMASLAAEAQPAGKVARIGYLAPGTATTSTGLRIPRQRCHRFQVNPATDSTAKLPLIP